MLKKVDTSPANPSHFFTLSIQVFIGCQGLEPKPARSQDVRNFYKIEEFNQPAHNNVNGRFPKFQKSASQAPPALRRVGLTGQSASGLAESNGTLKGVSTDFWFVAFSASIDC